MDIIKSSFKRWNGSSWDTHFFATSADLVHETNTKKILTSAERGNLTLLESFNAKDKLLQLDGSGMIPSALIPGGLDYLKINNPSFTGTLSGGASGMANVPGGYFGELYTLAGVTEGVVGIKFITEGMQIITDTEPQMTFQAASRGINVHSKKLINLGTPEQSSDAATKLYVDSQVMAGFNPIESVKCATTGPVASLSGVLKIDSYQTSIGDRVLVKNQDTASQNGIWVVKSSGWDKVENESKKGSYVFVENGSTQNDWYYFAETVDSWFAHGRPDTITNGAGITKTGNQLFIDEGAITNDMLIGGIPWAKLGLSPQLTEKSSWSGQGGMTDPQDGGSLLDLISSALGSIALSRGTAYYNTDNTQTIAGAYTKIDTKNTTFVSGEELGTTGYEVGDIHLQTIAST